MNPTVYRYAIPPGLPLEEIEGALLLAVLATESLHGKTQVRLDAFHLLDPDTQTCVIDASTPVGRDLNRLFAGFLRREFGADALTVERVGRVTGTGDRCQVAGQPERDPDGKQPVEGRFGKPPMPKVWQA